MRKRRRRIRINIRRFTASLIAAAVVITALALALYFYIDSRPTALREPAAEVGGIPVITDFIPKGAEGRPGQVRKIKYIVIHETGNAGRNANAASHNKYLHEAALSQQKSWHYTVDDHEIFYHIPDNEVAFHAGDGLRKDGGNLNGIGIEMCVNPENDYEQTLKNTAELVAMLLSAYGLDIDRVKTHHDFSGKDCPEILLSKGRWEEFTGMVKQELNGE